MIKKLAIAVVLCASPALAEPSNFTGCFVEGSGTGHFIRSSGVSSFDKQVGVGAGCDYAWDKVVFGVAARYDTGDLQSAVIAPRIGFEINPSMLAYAVIPVRLNINSRGVDDVSVGAGIETYALSKNLTLFVEATQAVGSLSSHGVGDDIAIRAGARWRFGSVLPGF